MTRRTETGDTIMTTEKASRGTWLAASLHGRSATEDTTETTVTYVMSSTPKMHTAKSKDNTEIGSVKSKNSVMKGTMIIMVLPLSNLTRKGHRKWDTSPEVLRHIPYS
jgi:hypothetical protein